MNLTLDKVMAENEAGSFEIRKKSFQIGGQKLVSRKRLHIIFSRGEELWFAEYGPLDIIATGTNPEEAFTEFTNLLFHYFRHYSDLESEKARGQALKLKKLFAETFIEVSA